MCKIYEDNALGHLPDARYAALDAQYAREQDALSKEITTNGEISKVEQERITAQRQELLEELL